jgi:hypothetical protein
MTAILGGSLAACSGSSASAAGEGGTGIAEAVAIIEEVRE